jgi:hypothetical protein
MCKACSFPLSGLCEDINDQCSAAFCNDFCLGDGLWTCSVKGKEEWEGKVSPAESLALCAQIKGFACSESVDCCAKDDDPKEEKTDKFGPLRQWVIAQSSRGAMSRDDLASYMTGSLPIEQCRHDPFDSDATDMACAACKSKLVIELAMVADEPNLSCRSFISKGAPGASPEEKGDHKGMYERCIAAHPAMMEAKNGAASKFTAEELCKCAGCCTSKPKDDGKPTPAECPFPTYSLL